MGRLILWVVVGVGWGQGVMAMVQSSDCQKLFLCLKTSELLLGPKISKTVRDYSSLVYVCESEQSDESLYTVHELVPKSKPSKDASDVAANL